MNDNELKDFLKWLSEATGITEDADLQVFLENLSEEDKQSILKQWKSNSTTMAKNGTKLCKNDEIPQFLKIGGKTKHCGCKKIKDLISQEKLNSLKEEIFKCGGKMKKVKKK